MPEAAYSWLSISLLIVCLAAVVSIVFTSWRNGISPMPASADVRRKLKAELRRLPEVKHVADAGSGWGTLSLALARHCPDKQVRGIENSPIPLLVSRLLAGKKVTYSRGDLYTYAYEGIDLVICYLYPGAMKRLDPIFRERLAPGTLVISICFALPNWEAEKVIWCTDLYRTPIYCYRQPREYTLHK